MDERLDEALEAEATRTGTSKAALIRDCVSARYRGLPSVDSDPLTALLAMSDDEPVGDIDAVVYEA